MQLVKNRLTFWQSKNCNVKQSITFFAASLLLRTNCLDSHQLVGILQWRNKWVKSNAGLQPRPLGCSIKSTNATRCSQCVMSTPLHTPCFCPVPCCSFSTFYKVKIISGVKLQIISETFEVLIKCTNRCLSTLTERECSNMVFVQSRKSPVTVVSYVCPSRLLSVRGRSLQISKLGWIWLLSEGSWS